MTHWNVRDENLATKAEDLRIKPSEFSSSTSKFYNFCTHNWLTIYTISDEQDDSGEIIDQNKSATSSGALISYNPIWEIPDLDNSQKHDVLVLDFNGKQ